MTGEMTRAISPLHVSQSEPSKWLTDSIANQPPPPPPDQPLVNSKKGSGHLFGVFARG